MNLFERMEKEIYGEARNSDLIIKRFAQFRWEFFGGNYFLHF